MNPREPSIVDTRKAERGIGTVLERIQLTTTLSIALNQVLIEAQAFELIAQYTPRLIGSDRASVALMEGDAHVRVIALQGHGGLEEGVLLDLKATTIGRAIELRETIARDLRIPLPGAVPIGPSHLAEEGFVYSIVTPLATAGKVRGTLNVAYREVPDRADAVPMVEQVSAMLSSTLDRLRLTASLQLSLVEAEDKGRRLRALAEMGEAMAAATDEATVIALFGSSVGRMFEMQHSSIVQRIDEVTVRVVYAAGVGPPIGSLVPIEGMPFQRCFELGRTVYIPDFHGRFPDVPDAILKVDLGSVVSTPLRVDGRVWGAFNLAERRTRLYDDLDVALASHVAAFVATSLTRVYSLDRAEQARSEAELAKAKAEAASDAKGQFLAQMSHEIRTPMSGVIGVAELLKDTPLTEEQAHYIDLIQSSGRTLLGILGDVLDFAKIEAGHLQLAAIDVDPMALFRETIEPLDPFAREKGITLAIELDPYMPRQVFVDPLRVRQVVTNLVSNALKFTAVGGVVVRVSHDASKQRMAIHVEDTGKGIAPAMQESIFEAFEQEDASTTRRFGGTGLGLSISRKLCTMMDGTLTLVESSSAGTIFRATVHATAVNTLSPSVAAPPTPARRLARQTVLLIEDNPLNQFVARRMLEGMGYV
ncbi:MAG: signal transduction histidine kinase, partial [Myxococcota bacterium]